MKEVKVAFRRRRNLGNNKKLPKPILICHPRKPPPRGLNEMSSLFLLPDVIVLDDDLSVSKVTSVGSANHGTASRGHRVFPEMVTLRPKKWIAKKIGVCIL
jgi:hypothetical protein